MAAPARKRVKHDSEVPLEASGGRQPMQLEFYQGTWSEILQLAKQLFHVWLVIKCPWPELNTHLIHAKNCLVAAIQKYRKKGSKIEEGVSQLYSNFLSQSLS